MQSLSRLQTERAYLSTFDDAEELDGSPLISWREIRRRRIGERKAAAQAEDREIMNHLNTTPFTRTTNAAGQLSLAGMKNEAICPDATNRYLNAIAEAYRKNKPNSAPPAAPAAPAPQNEPNPQVPRSAPCPCGSGQKYKRCCGKDAPPVLFQTAAA
jgi:hypothetical protein